MNKTFQWAIVGAGPAGIIAVGKLLDNGVLPSDILWVDPMFSVGDLGARWQEVSSNTKVQLFTDAFAATASFGYNECAADASVRTLNPDSTCTLKHAVEPLQAITRHLKAQVSSCQSNVQQLTKMDTCWKLTTSNQQFCANNIVLATGSEPNHLDYNIAEIPLVTALTPSVLENKGIKGKTVAVFGSSHSAVLVMKNCIEAGARVINFYRSDIKHAIYHDNWIEFDNTGLKGIASVFAREHIQARLHPQLHRYLSDTAYIEQYLPDCDYAVYAVGFAPRLDIRVDPKIDFSDYNPHTGKIAGQLYGCGIAFPEAIVDRSGHHEYSVGIWKFNNYLDRVIPEWLGK